MPLYAYRIAVRKVLFALFLDKILAFRNFSSPECVLNFKTDKMSVICKEIAEGKLTAGIIQRQVDVCREEKRIFPNNSAGEKRETQNSLPRHSHNPFGTKGERAFNFGSRSRSISRLRRERKDMSFPILFWHLSLCSTCRHEPFLQFHRLPTFSFQIE